MDSRDDQHLSVLSSIYQRKKDLGFPRSFSVFASSARRLSTNRRRIVDQEIAGATMGIVRIRCLWSVHPRWLSILHVRVVAKMSLVVGTTSLPSQCAWAAANGATTCIAPSMQKIAARTAQHRDCHQTHHSQAAFHMRHPLRSTKSSLRRGPVSIPTEKTYRTIRIVRIEKSDTFVPFGAVQVATAFLGSLLSWDL